MKTNITSRLAFITLLIIVFLSSCESKSGKNSRVQKQIEKEKRVNKEFDYSELSNTFDKYRNLIEKTIKNHGKILTYTFPNNSSGSLGITRLTYPKNENVISFRDISYKKPNVYIEKTIERDTVKKELTLTIVRSEDNKEIFRKQILIISKEEIESMMRSAIPLVEHRGPHQEF